MIEAQANGLWVVTTKDLVPADINVTGRATFVPLSASPEKWAEAVLTADMRETSWESNVEVAEKYEIRIGAERMTRVYTGLS